MRNEAYIFKNIKENGIMAYAEKTSVSVVKTKADIEELIQKAEQNSLFPAIKKIWQ